MREFRPPQALEAFAAQSMPGTKDPSRRFRRIPRFAPRGPSLGQPWANDCEPWAFGRFLPGPGLWHPSPWDNQTTYDLLIGAIGQPNPKLPAGAIEARARNASPNCRPEFNDRTTIDLIAKRINCPWKSVGNARPGRRGGSPQRGSAGGLVALADLAQDRSHTTPRRLRTDLAPSAVHGSADSLRIAFTEVGPCCSARPTPPRNRRCKGR